MELALSQDELRAVAEPVLAAVAGQLAERMTELAEAIAKDREGYMDKDAAAVYLSTSVRTLEAWMRPVSEGGRGLPHIKIGEAVRFRRSSIDAWMGRQERNAVAAPLLMAS